MRRWFCVKLMVTTVLSIAVWTGIQHDEYKIPWLTRVR